MFFAPFAWQIGVGDSLIAVRDQIFWRMQDFDFTQILINKFCPKLRPNLAKFTQI